MTFSRQHLDPLLLIAGLLMCSTVTHQQYYEKNQFTRVPSFYSTSYPSLITSYLFGSRDYPNNVSQKIMLRNKEVPRVFTFHFRQFNVEYHPSCDYDALYLRGIPFCGGWEVGRQIPFLVQPWEDFTLIFKSDDIVSRSGFEILFVPDGAHNFNGTKS